MLDFFVCVSACVCVYMCVSMCVFYILSACLSVCVRLHLCVSLYLSVCESVMFSYATSFNGDIPKWDVSSVSVIHAILSYVASDCVLVVSAWCLLVCVCMFV